MAESGITDFEVDGAHFIEHGDICEMCKSTSSAGYCSGCECYMCQACYDNHVGIRKYKDHVLQVEPEIKEDNCTIHFKTCTEHTQQEVRLYCTDHKCFGCGECMAFDHKSCKYKYITEASNDFQDSGEMARFLEDIQDLENIHENCVESIASQSEHSDNINKTTTNDVKKFVKEVVSYVTDEEKRVIKNAGSKKSLNDNKIEKLSNDLQRIGSDITSICTKIRSEDNSHKRFILAMETKPKLSEIRDTLASIDCQEVIDSYTFHPNRLLRRQFSEKRPIGKLSDYTQSEEDDEEDYERKYNAECLETQRFKQQLSFQEKNINRLEQQLSTKQEEIKRLELQISSKELQHKQQLSSQTREILRLKQQLSVKEQDINRLKQQMSTQEHQLKQNLYSQEQQFKQQLSTKTQENERLTQQVSTKTQENERLTQQLSTKTQENERLTQQLSTKTQENERLTQQLSTKTQENERLTQQLSTKTQENERLTQQLSTKTQENERLTQQLSTKTQENERLTQQLSSKEQENQRLQEQLSAQEKAFKQQMSTKDQQNQYRLACGHVCDVDQMNTNRTVKCPTCGIIFGDQPNGTFRTEEHKHRIELKFKFDKGTLSKMNLNPGKPYEGNEVTGIVYNNAIGRCILNMLKLAFDRKLLFTVDANGQIVTNEIDIFT